MRTNCDYTEARDLLLELVQPGTPEEVSLEHCAGRVLARDLEATEDVPPFDRSPFDGYALRSADVQGASREQPVTLQVVEEIPAGYMWTKPVVPGTAAKILTGAPVPDGADTVCMYEKTEFTQETVTLFGPCRPGDNVVRRGEDVQRGQVLARAGTVIDGALAGTLAGQGMVRPVGFPALTGGILTTGSELTEPGEPLGPGKIVNSNRYTFAGALEHLGVTPLFCGAPGDRLEDIVAALQFACAACPLVIVTGGVSVGDYDLTPAALEAAGGEVWIRNVSLKPGGKCCYGTLEGALVCCLSGNPASSMTNFLAVALPAIRKMMGLAQPALPEIPVTLAAPFPKKSPRARLIRGTLELSSGTVRMVLPQGQGNTMLYSMSGCNLLAMVPAGSPPLEAGTVLTAYLLP